MGNQKMEESVVGIATFSNEELTDKCKALVMELADKRVAEYIGKGKMTAEELKYVLAVALIYRDFFGRRKIVLTLNRMNSLKDSNPTGKEDIIIVSRKRLSEQEKLMVRDEVRKKLDVSVSQGKMTEEDRARTMLFVHVDRKFWGSYTMHVLKYTWDSKPNSDAITVRRQVNS